MPPFQNPFTKRRREREEAERAKIEAELKRAEVMAQTALPQKVVQGRVLPREPTIKPATIVDLLTVAQDTLQRLRGLPASDMGAFPLVNESQRHGKMTTFGQFYMQAWQGPWQGHN